MRYTLSADKELRKFLHVEAARSITTTLGNEIYKTYTQWKKAEQGDGLQIPRKKIAWKPRLRAVVASPDMLEDRSKQWEDQRLCRWQQDLKFSECRLF
eukprot:Skav201030  [mRNA]  locus=scaffold3386:121311:122803:+ [translate_table: standard]